MVERTMLRATVKINFVLFCNNKEGWLSRSSYSTRALLFGFGDSLFFDTFFLDGGFIIR